MEYIKRTNGENVDYLHVLGGDGTIPAPPVVKPKMHQPTSQWESMTPQQQQAYKQQLAQYMYKRNIYQQQRMAQYNRQRAAYMAKQQQASQGGKVWDLREGAGAEMLNYIDDIGTKILKNLPPPAGPAYRVALLVPRVVRWIAVAIALILFLIAIPVFKNGKIVSGLWLLGFAAFFGLGIGWGLTYYARYRMRPTVIVLKNKKLRWGLEKVGIKVLI